MPGLGVAKWFGPLLYEMQYESNVLGNIGRQILLPPVVSTRELGIPLLKAS